MNKAFVSLTIAFAIALCPVILFYLSVNADTSVASDPPPYQLVSIDTSEASDLLPYQLVNTDTPEASDLAPHQFVSSVTNDVKDQQRDSIPSVTVPQQEEEAAITTLTPTQNSKLSGKQSSSRTEPTVKVTVPSNSDKKTAVRFLYLLQTEGCLPSKLRTNETLGDGSLDFHVLVLSFRGRCDDTSLPHVEYLFDPSTTWTTGRNLLFNTAMKRNVTYLYYIFMDDDVSIVDSRTNTVAWRAFEEFLISTEPAVAGLDLPGQDYVSMTLQTRSDRGCATSELDYVPALWYDAMVNAFHYKAVRHLLPYISTFDERTWWASQMALIVRTEILFRGHLVLHRYIHGFSSQSRPYPRDLNFTPDMYSVFTKGLDAHIVPGCVTKCAQTMIEKWMKRGNAQGWQSSTLCLPPPPPHDPIKPCRYQCHLV